MRMSTARRIAIAGVAALLVLASCTSGTDAGSGSDDGKDIGSDVAATKGRREWLFAIQSDGPSSYDAATATLSLPTGTVNAFTDRPYRDTRATSPLSFANLWNDQGPDSFAADPPNAVLTYWEDAAASSAPKSVVCEITGDVRYSTADDVLAMGVRVLEPEGATLPAQLFNASLFVDDVPCQNSEQDEESIEYFNLENFNGNYSIQAASTDNTSFGLTLLCPERESPTYPPSELQVELTYPDGSATSPCNSTVPFTVRIGPDPSPTCDATSCWIIVAATNSETQATYSSTVVRLTPMANTTIVPTLNPATLPFCPKNVNPCLVDGTCQESPGQASIQLCESGTDCTTPGG